MAARRNHRLGRARRSRVRVTERTRRRDGADFSPAGAGDRNRLRTRLSGRRDRRARRGNSAEAGLAAAVAAMVSVDLKPGEPGIHALADRLDVPARFFSAERLLEETPRLTERSEAAFRATGCWGVAEGAALAAAGPDAELIVPKRKSRGATCAIARAAQPIDATTIGRATRPAGDRRYRPRRRRLAHARGQHAPRPRQDIVGYRPLSRSARQRHRRQTAARRHTWRGKSTGASGARSRRRRQRCRPRFIGRCRNLRACGPGLRTARPRRPARLAIARDLRVAGCSAHCKRQRRGPELRSATISVRFHCPT